MKLSLLLFSSRFFLILHSSLYFFICMTLIFRRHSVGKDLTAKAVFYVCFESCRNVCYSFKKKILKVLKRVKTNMVLRLGDSGRCLISCFLFSPCQFFRNWLVLRDITITQAPTILEHPYTYSSDIATVINTRMMPTYQVQTQSF